MLTFLNENSGVINVLVTFALVGITFWYAWLTRKIVKFSNIPKVLVFLGSVNGARFKGSTIDLCIQNIGTGYAFELI